MKANIPTVPEAPNASTSSPDNPSASATPPLILAPAPASKPAQEDPPAAKQIHKLSQRIIDLLEGHEHTSNCPSDPIVTPGIQAPTVIEEQNCVLEGERQAEWMMWMNFVEELLMASEMSDAEALEPRTLAEAKRHPDWPLWEKAIQEELETL